MNNSNHIRPKNDTIVYLSDLNEGEKFKVIGHPVPRVYVYKKQVKVKTLVFKADNGNGKFKIAEGMQFKIKVEKL